MDVHKVHKELTPVDVHKVHKVATSIPGSGNNFTQMQRSFTEHEVFELQDSGHNYSFQQPLENAGQEMEREMGA